MLRFALLKGGRRFQHLAFTLSIVMMLLHISALSSALRINRAHLALLQWSPLLPYGEGRHLLERAIDWGGNADPRWFAHGPGHRARALLAQMESDAWVDRSQRWQAFKKGQQLEAQGQAEDARRAYQSAAHQVELRVPSLYALYRLSQPRDPVMADEYLQSLDALEPDVQVSWITNDQCELLGFDVDTWSIAWDTVHVPIILYWQSSVNSHAPRRWSADDWHFIHVRDRLYQIGVVSNLLPNGGFEQDLSARAALPIGYQNIRDSRLRETSEIADFLRQHHDLVQAQRDGYLTQVTAMTGPAQRTNGFSAPRASVEKDTLYLLSGWMRTTNDSEGYLAGVWEKGTTELEYWKVADWSGHSSWRQYAAVAMPPPEADRLRFVALQRGSGQALFDELLLCQLHQPNLCSARD